LVKGGIWKGEIAVLKLGEEKAVIKIDGGILTKRIADLTSWWIVYQGRIFV